VKVVVNVVDLVVAVEVAEEEMEKVGVVVDVVVVGEEVVAVGIVRKPHGYLSPNWVVW
jgi:hypothetical protein